MKSIHVVLAALVLVAAGIAVYFLRLAPDPPAPVVAIKEKPQQAVVAAPAAPAPAPSTPAPRADQPRLPSDPPPPAADPSKDPSATIELDNEGRPTFNGVPVDPNSELYRRFIPPGTRLPTRSDLNHVVEQLRPLADECISAAPADKRSGFVLGLRFRGGSVEPPPKDVPFPELPAARCLREKLAAGGDSAKMLQLSDAGRWVWNTPQQFGEIPRHTGGATRTPPRPARR